MATPLATAIAALPDPILRDKAQRAVALVARTLDVFGPSALAFSFNGGKDSTVILHLLRAALEERSEDGAPSSIRTFIFDRPDDFPAVREFVDDMDGAYGLHVEHLTTSPSDGEGWKGMASALGRYLSSTGVKAVLLGTRRGDPNAGGQAEFCPSSTGWPAFMRVNPILDWTYADVWGFIDGLGVPYCSLYDAGYTSLGSTTSTVPNAALARPGGGFAPARTLADGRQERAGRGGAAPPPARPAPAPVAPTPTKKAAVLLVGDELLAARVEESNARFLCGRLHGAGWRVARVAILPDDEAAVADEVSAAAAACTAVVVAGGIGPTADDVTMAAVGRAFGLPMARDPDLEARLRGWFGPDKCTSAHLKMADAPMGVVAIDVVHGGREDGGGGSTAASAAAGSTDANAAAAAASPPKPSPFPLLAVRNVFILPGVPALLRRKWPALEAALAAQHGACAPFHAAALRLSLSDETAVGPALEAAAAAAGGAATVGSYPLHPPAKADGASVVVVVEGKDAGVVGAAVEAARAALESEPSTAGCVLAQVDGGAVEL